MRHFLAYVFIMIFSFQVLPVKELGKILFKGQMTEEVHEMGHSANDSNDGAGALKLKMGADLFKATNTGFVALNHYLNTKVTTAIHHSEQLPDNFEPEILTPPPNC